MRPHPLTLVLLLAALAGLGFAGFATYDFVAHLDRQVHGLHCSFFPGIGATDVTGASGCHVTLMSSYSSVFRTDIWGGLPIALPAMSVFSFLAFFAVFLIVTRRQKDSRATLFLLLGTLLPVLTSAGLGYVSLVTLGTACKLCVGIYVSSGVAFVAAAGLYVIARRAADDSPEEGALTPPAEEMTPKTLAVAFAVGVAFVGVPALAYALGAPEFDEYIGACGQLAEVEDEGGVLMPLGAPLPGVPVIEVLDPLCGACRGFEQRLGAVEAASGISRRVLLFPLDKTCNWMIDDTIHPGACAISEAVICAQDDAADVLDWAFANQDAILTAARADADAAARMARERFPDLAPCIGSAAARARLNLSLRWAVDHELPVLTPQLYVGQTRLCDADTDLGLDYVLTQLIERTPSASAPRPTRPLVAGEAVPATHRIGAPGRVAERVRPPPRPAAPIPPSVAPEDDVAPAVGEPADEAPEAPPEVDDSPTEAP